MNDNDKLISTEISTYLDRAEFGQGFKLDASCCATSCAPVHVVTHLQVSRMGSRGLSFALRYSFIKGILSQDYTSKLRNWVLSYAR